MGMKEKDLQTVEAFNTGDFPRVVTSDGKSRKVDKGAVGGNAPIVTILTYSHNESDVSIYVSDIEPADILNYLTNGKVVIGIIIGGDGTTVFSTDSGLIDYATGVLRFKPQNQNVALANLNTGVNEWKTSI